MYLQSLLQQNQNYSDEETEGPGSGRGTPVRERSTKNIAKVHLRTILLLHVHIPCSANVWQKKT